MSPPQRPSSCTARGAAPDRKCRTPARGNESVQKQADLPCACPLRTPTHEHNRSARGGREQTAGSGHATAQIPRHGGACGELCRGSWGWGPLLTCPHLRSLLNFERCLAPPPARGALAASRPACAGRPQKAQNRSAALSSALPAPPRAATVPSPARPAPAQPPPADRRVP